MGWIGGKSKEIVVDDHFPVKNSDIGTLFGKEGENGKIWSAIVDKAWAKVNMSYKQASKPSANDIIYFMTGIPSYEIKMRNN